MIRISFLILFLISAVIKSNGYDHRLTTLENLKRHLDRITLLSGNPIGYPIGDQKWGYFKIPQKQEGCNKFSDRQEKIINGGWSSWSQYTRFYNGERARKRDCNSPTPNFNGRQCQGSGIEIDQQMFIAENLLRLTCPVPNLQPGATLKQAVKNLKVIIGFIERKLEPMTRQIKRLNQEVRKAEKEIVSAYGVLMDYRQAYARLNATLRKIDKKINLSKKCVLLKKFREMNTDKKYLKADQKKFQRFTRNVDYTLKAKEKEKKRLIKKKTEATNLRLKLKNLILDYELYTDSSSETFDLDPEVANEERDEINYHLKEGTKQLKTIFC